MPMLTPSSDPLDDDVEPGLVGGPARHDADALARRELAGLLEKLVAEAEAGHDDPRGAPGRDQLDRLADELGLACSGCWATCATLRRS